MDSNQLRPSSCGDKERVEFASRASDARLGRRALSLLVFLFSLCLLPSVAFAGDKDITSTSFADPFPATPCTTNPYGVCGTASEGYKDEFKFFSKDLAVILAPPMTRPASSIGVARTSVMFNVTANFMFEGSDKNAQLRKDAWTKASGKRKDLSEDIFVVGNVTVVKGLPYGFDLGAHASLLFDSNIATVGLELKWAFLEGYEFAPDIAIRAMGGVSLGVPNLTHVYTGADITLSKTFGLGGVMALTPTLGYQSTVAISGIPQLHTYPAGPRVPLKGTNNQGTYDPIFSVSTDISADRWTHRIGLGLDMQASIFKVGLDFTYATSNIFQFSTALGILY